jgi:hypothetical protein
MEYIYNKSGILDKIREKFKKKPTRSKKVSEGFFNNNMR